MKLITPPVIFAFSLGFQIINGLVTPPAQAGRYVLNQTPQTIRGAFGSPLSIETFPANPNVKSYTYSSTEIRRIFPDFPWQGRFGMTYENDRVTHVWLVPSSIAPAAFNSFDPRKFFSYIFAYEPSIWKELQRSGGGGFTAYNGCLGDGVAISFTQYRQGFDNISMTYNSVCEPPYWPTGWTPR
jgi:hypothetical protein